MTDNADIWLVPSYEQLHVVARVARRGLDHYCFSLDLHTSSSSNRMMFFDSSHLTLLEDAIAGLHQDIVRLAWDKDCAALRHLTRLVLPKTL